ncbi:uncharacterized protein LOC120249311 [Dioscorea cayenensis subsp. rotundata]|uniref:Uncharacterized protein LOC120249311 n=1 Tax=Dioscorea cayennensis subsp. rotundata TaxID=55577 RepID=A0AB40AFR2_DIOCR|nr:uncharacterized protein LOC120249311 [Dioscorea cayenensis subsp. rotundata]
MSSSAFLSLCDMLVRDGGLRATLHVSVEEQVAKTLYVLGHNVTHRELSFFFRHSRETTFRHFHNVLQVIIELEDKFITQPDGAQIPSEIFSSNRFYPYFKIVLVLLMEHIFGIKVSSAEAPKYRVRKDYPTQNVLVACTFDLKFTYVLPGWEGTTSDSRIIKNALSRPYPLRIPEGKYYLVDAGFMLRSGLITPYKGEQYHLKEYSRNPPTNPRDRDNWTTCRDRGDYGGYYIITMLEGRARVTNPRLFDLHSSSSSVVYHPNIQSVKSSSDVKEYIEKGGDYVDWGQFQVDGRSSRDGRHNLSTVYADALNSGSMEAALQIIWENNPRAFTLQYHNLKPNYERIFQKPLDLYT